MRIAIAALALVAALSAAHAENHPCSADAVAKATQLLRLHGDLQANDPVDVEKTVKVLAPIKALEGNGRIDVLEVWGHIYKASYRMRLIYAQIKGSCVLMGEEILEASDPY
jgi:hypothetical protein